MTDIMYITVATVSDDFKIEVMPNPICKNCKWFHPADMYFFCENEHVPFVENGLIFTDEIEYWGCNQWEKRD